MIGPHENLDWTVFFKIATISKCISTIKYWYVSQLNSCDKKYGQKPPNVIINAFGFCVVWLAGFIEKTSLQLVDFANVYLAENMYQNWVSRWQFMIVLSLDSQLFCYYVARVSIWIGIWMTPTLSWNLKIIWKTPSHI